MYPLILATLMFIVSAAKGEVAPGTGLQLSAAADILGQFDLAQNSGGTNRLEVREAEVLLYSPVDQLFDGYLSLAAHQEDGKTAFELHEAYLGSSRLIPRSRFRVGQYFLAFGRLNQFHRHDWPFTTAPKFFTDFFNNDEGVLDTGAEYSYLVPIALYLDITAGISNGWVFGHADVLGKKPHVPTHYLRAATFLTLPWKGGIQTGLNYVGRKDDTGTTTTFVGIDATAKWREAQFLQFLFQSELWLKSSSLKDASTDNTLGFYLYPQYGIDQRLSVGFRLDGYSVLNSDTKNFEYGFVPVVTYKPSDFSTIRASYTHTSGYIDDLSTAKGRIFEVQAVFVLGSHPAHDF